MDLAALFDTREPTIDALRAAPVKLRYLVKGKVRRVLMDKLTADAILAVYEALPDESKGKVERMLGNAVLVGRLAGFCFQRVKVGA